MALTLIVEAVAPDVRTWAVVDGCVAINDTL